MATNHFASIVKSVGFDSSVNDATAKELNKLGMRIVRNVLNNVIIIADASQAKMLNASHFLAASKVCGRSLELLHGTRPAAGGMSGGAIVMPSEYFGGPANPAYSAAGYASMEQSSLSTTEFTRPEMHMTGGARRRKSGVPVEVVVAMAKAYLKKVHRKDLMLADTGVAALKKALDANMGLVLSKLKKMSRTRTITTDGLKRCVSSTFSFLE